MTIDRRTFVQSRNRGCRCRRRHPGRASAADAPLASDHRRSGGGRSPIRMGCPTCPRSIPRRRRRPDPTAWRHRPCGASTSNAWILDNIIRANGIDWDQPRLPGLAAALGPEATTDIAAIRTRVQKFADIAPAFEAVARRREARAIEAAKQEDKVGARDNFFMAANFWGGAQWPIDENNAKNIFFNQKKRECYLKYAKLADHRVEPAWIALDGKSLPGWFHLPYGYQAGSGCRAWSRFRAWTATRSAACRSPATASCRGASRSSWSRISGPIRERGAGRPRQHSRPGQAAAPAISTGWRRAEIEPARRSSIASRL